MKSVALLFNKIQLKSEASLSDFKKVFNHISVYEAKKQMNQAGNSKYVFLGMYAFKGVLAKLIFKYIGGNGKQLQHYLGNLFTNDRLAQICDELALGDYAKMHKPELIESHKHIFTLAYLGFLAEHATTDYQIETANALFLQANNQSMPKTTGINLVQLLKAKADQICGQKIKIRYEQTSVEDKVLHITQVCLTSGDVIGRHESVSKLYSKKKALKLAMLHLLDMEAKTPAFQEMAKKQEEAERLKKEREKAEKAKKHLAFLQQKQETRTKIRQEKKQEAKEREIQRNLNKANAKKRGTGKTDKEKITVPLKNPSKKITK